MIIRESTENDFGQIILLFKQLWPNKQTIESKLNGILGKSLTNENCIMLTVEDDHVVIGFCSMIIINSFWQESNIGYITTLIVEEKMRQQGIGKSLFQSMIDIALQKNCKKIELDSAFSREKAHQFYTNFGFVKRAYLFSKDLVIDN